MLKHNFYYFLAFPNLLIFSANFSNKLLIYRKTNVFVTLEHLKYKCIKALHLNNDKQIKRSKHFYKLIENLISDEIQSNNGEIILAHPSTHTRTHIIEYRSIVDRYLYPVFSYKGVELSTLRMLTA